MNKSMKSILAIIIAGMMLFTSLPVSATATTGEETQTSESATQDGKLYTYFDETTGISLITEYEGGTFTVNEITDLGALLKMERELHQEESIITAYDISFTSSLGNEITDFSRNATLKIPTAEGATRVGEGSKTSADLYSTDCTPDEEGFFNLVLGNYQRFALIGEFTYTYTDEETGVYVVSSRKCELKVEETADEMAFAEFNAKTLPYFCLTALKAYNVTLYDEAGEEIIYKHPLFSPYMVYFPNEYKSPMVYNEKSYSSYKSEDGNHVGTYYVKPVMYIISDNVEYKYTDEATGVYMETTMCGSFSVTEITDEQVLYDVDKTIGNPHVKGMYELKFYDALGKEVEKYKDYNAVFSIPSDDSMDTVYKLNEDGSYERINTYCSIDGYIEIDAETSGVYVLASDRPIRYTDEKTGVCFSTYERGSLVVTTLDETTRGQLDYDFGEKSVFEIYDVKFYDVFSNEIKEFEYGAYIFIPSSDMNNDIYKLTQTEDGYTCVEKDSFWDSSNKTAAVEDTSTGIYAVVGKKLFTFTDEATGISVDTYVNGSLEVNDVSDRFLLSDTDRAYNVTLYNEILQKEDSPAGGVTIRIPVASDDEILYRMTTDDEFEVVNYRFENGMALFEADATGLFVVSSPESDPPEIIEYIGLLGDANEDGIVNIKDATAIQKHIASLEALTDTGVLLADVDTSGDVNIKDATAIQKYIAGIETGYSIGELVE